MVGYSPPDASPVSRFRRYCTQANTMRETEPNNEQTIHSYSVSAEDGGPGLTLDGNKLYQWICETPDLFSEADKSCIEVVNRESTKTYGPHGDVDANNLSEARWGI